jgi:hypothetical protein
MGLFCLLAVECGKLIRESLQDERGGSHAQGWTAHVIFSLAQIGFGLNSI